MRREPCLPCRVPSIPRPASPACRRLALLALLLLLCLPTARATYLYRDGSLQVMDWTDGVESLMGDIEFTGGAFYAVYPRNIAGGTQYNLSLHKFDLDGAPVAGYPVLVPNTVKIFYEPKMCWNGASFGIAYSIYTRGEFMVVSPAGQVLVPPVSLPNIPVGGRAAAFKPYWTGDGYTVFGLILTPTEPGQGTNGTFYNYLACWTLDPAGNVRSFQVVRDITAMTYPKYNGQEHNWYDAAWSGGAFLLTYLQEPPGGGMPTTLYRIVDARGNTTRAEAKAFAGAVPTGNHNAACSGTSFAVAAVRDEGTFQINRVVRFYDLAGNPLAAETRFNAAGGNTVDPSALSWQGDKYALAYVYIDAYGYNSPYMLQLATFSAAGVPVDPDYQIGQADFPQFQMQTNLKMVGDGDKIFFQGIYFNLISSNAMVYAYQGDVGTPAPPVVIAPNIGGAFADNGRTAFQWRPVAKNNQYTLQFGTTPQFTTSLGTANFTGTAPAAFDLSALRSGKGVNPGTKIYWRLKGANTSYGPARPLTVDPNVWINPRTVAADFRKSGSTYTPVGGGRSAQALQEALPDESGAGESARVARALAPLALDPAVRVDSLNPQSTPQHVRGRFRLPLAGRPEGERVRALAAALGPAWRLANPAEELDAPLLFTDNLGYRHYRFDQRARGIPVLGARLSVHLDAAGDVYAFSGSTHPTPTASADPAVTASRAEAAVRETIREAAGRPAASLLWYPAETGLRLAWSVRIVDESRALDTTGYVDAQNGLVLNYHTNINRAYPGTYVQGTGTTSLGAATPVPLYKVGSLYHPILRTRAYDNADPLAYSITNAAGGLVNEKIREYVKHGAILLLNSKGKVFGTDRFDFEATAVDDKMVADLSKHLQATLDFYWNRWKWNSWDGKGAGMLVFCHMDSPFEGGGAMDNAFFNGDNGYAAFGDGTDPAKFRFFSASQDWVTHEFSHGVTASSSNLIYSYMSGALNEAFSDIMAQANDPNDWLWGEELVVLPQTDPLYKQFVRNLQDPTWGGVWDPNDTSKGGLPGHMNQFFLVGPDRDNGGVHYNNGIISRAAYELAQRTSKTVESNIVFRANTVYLAPGAQFLDMRRACLQAAADLYPGQAATLAAIRTAFDTVGITEAGSAAAPTPTYPANRVAIADDQITFTWTAVPGAKYYLFEISPDASMAQTDGMLPMYSIKTPAPEAQYKISGMPTGFKFYWRVRSDTSAFSPIREFTYGAAKHAEGTARIVNLFSQGASGLTVKSVAKAGTAAWLTVKPAFALPTQFGSGGSYWIQVVANPAGLGVGQYKAIVNVGTSMTTRNPYPGGIAVTMTILPSKAAGVEAWEDYGATKTAD